MDKHPLDFGDIAVRRNGWVVQWSKATTADWNTRKIGDKKDGDVVGSGRSAWIIAAKREYLGTLLSAKVDTVGMVPRLKKKDDVVVCLGHVGHGSGSKMDAKSRRRPVVLGRG